MKNNIRTGHNASFSLNYILLLILAVLIIPSAVNAKTIKIAYSPIPALETGFFVSNSSVHSAFLATSSDADEDVQTDTPEDLEKADKLNAYFDKRDMPLSGYGIEFIRAANKYGLDWRLLPAIGVKESSGGKHMMNNNPFGWGSAKIKFEDFSEAIDMVAMNLGGYNPSTARYYKDSDIDKKLWYYNGSVIRSYPGEIKNIMAMF
jgi:hypothetical protein